MGIQRALDIPIKERYILIHIIYPQVIIIITIIIHYSYAHMYVRPNKI
jgi:hypothetical protein